MSKATTYTLSEAATGQPVYETASLPEFLAEIARRCDGQPMGPALDAYIITEVVHASERDAWSWWWEHYR